MTKPFLEKKKTNYSSRGIRHLVLQAKIDFETRKRWTREGQGTLGKSVNSSPLTASLISEATKQYVGIFSRLQVICLISFLCFWRRHRPFEGLFHTWNNGEDNFNVQHEEDILLYFRHLVYVFLCNSFPCVVVDVPAAFQRGKCCYRHERKRKVRWRPLSERCILLSKIKYNWENWKRVIEQALQWDDDVIMCGLPLCWTAQTHTV